MNQLLKIVLMGLLLSPSLAQTTDSTSRISVIGYIEAYYSYDFNQPFTNERPSFVYSHNRHNEFNINLGFV
ncbi:MAG: outer membrane beta-barrel protein, partial [Runella zeae]